VLVDGLGYYNCFFIQFQSTTLSVTQRNRVRIVLQEVSKDILKVVEMCL